MIKRRAISKYISCLFLFLIFQKYVEARTLFYLSNAKNLINTVINEVFVSKKVHVLLTAPFKVSCHIPCQFNEKTTKFDQNKCHLHNNVF